jgi:hypothetical protein
MRTDRQNRSRMAPALCGALAVLLTSGSALAQVIASDQRAGLIVFPKVWVDTTGQLTGGVRVDTIIQLTNVSSSDSRSLHCFWINANSRCSISGDFCDPTSSDPALNCRDGRGTCQQDWRATNFAFEMTPNQPIGFRASSGCGALNVDCPGLADGRIFGVPENPFIGELKCVQVEVADPLTLEPIPENDIIGSARIYEVTDSSVDVREYAAIGIQATEDVDTNGTLCLGSSDPDCDVAEYASCPGTLILDHFFEDSFPFGDDVQVSTVLTLVPCTESIDVVGNASNLTGQTSTAVQIAVYNEFEQRLSSSTRVNCFRSIRLADIDTRVGTGDNASSIFGVGVQGTLTGQTRLRGVPTTSPRHGLLGLAEERYSNGFSTAFNLQFEGSRTDGNGDVITTTP